MKYTVNTDMKTTVRKMVITLRRSTAEGAPIAFTVSEAVHIAAAAMDGLACQQKQVLLRIKFSSSS